VPPAVPEARLVRAGDEGFAMQRPKAADCLTAVADERPDPRDDLRQNETLLASVMNWSYVSFALEALARVSCWLNSVFERSIDAIAKYGVWQLNRLAIV
jgi:hypothetical protein